MTERRLPADNRTLGWQVIEWCNRWLQQPDGPDAGNPWRFTDEQAQMVLAWYEIDDNGRFTNRRGVIRRMKGWGKDPFVAALSFAEACGPVRFAGWGLDEMPVGTMHPAPWIQIAAVSREQTKTTMTLLPGMIPDPTKKEYALNPGKEIWYVRGGLGRIEAVTSSPRSLEGSRPSLVVLNETHHWLQNNEGLEMADVIRRNLGKSRDGSARSIEITNAHLPGEKSVAEQTYDAIKAGDVAGVWYDALEAPEVKDLSDTAAVKAALTVARGGSHWVDVDRVTAEIQDPITPEYKSRRFYLNQVVLVDIDRWLPQGAWAKLAHPELHLESNERIIMGFDGSYDGDATGLIAATIDRPVIHVVQLGVWERPYGDFSWRTPRKEIGELMRDTFHNYRVEWLTVDPALWQTDLEDLQEEGYPVETFTQRGQDMLNATQRLYELVVSASLTHDGSEALARHMGNAYVKDPTRPKLQKEVNARKIDLAVATVMAVQRAEQVAHEGQYATVVFGSDYMPKPNDDDPSPLTPFRKPPRILTQEDVTTHNQFNIVRPSA